MIRSLFDACSVEYRSDHPIAISLTNFNPKYHKAKEEVKEDSKDKEEKKVVNDALNFESLFLWIRNMFLYCLTTNAFKSVDEACQNALKFKRKYVGDVKLYIEIEL